MKLAKEDFENDSQAVIEFYPRFLEIVMRMGQHRVAQKQLEEFKVPQGEELLRKLETQFEDILRIYKPSIHEIIE